MDKRKDKIIEGIKPILEAAGLELVDFKLFSSGRKTTLRFAVDYPAGGVNMDECASANRNICLFLESSGIILDNYTVEVNSPGLDRPLKGIKDFMKAEGKVVLLWLNEPVEDSLFMEGEIKAVEKDSLILNFRDKVLKIGLDKIKTGKEKIKI